MKFRFLILLLGMVPFVLGWGRCETEEALTAGEALKALEEVALSSQALNVASGSGEISTNFTIGQAVEAAAEELQEFIESQLPCAAITLDGATLNIEYGAYPLQDCTYNGQTYSGVHRITIASASAGNLVVEHEWEELANQTVSVTGSATVTWSTAEGSRNVVHELTWTRLADGWETVGGGDRTQAGLNGEITSGLTVDGTRYWTSERGAWDLDINNIELRWIDPVPESGFYELDTPFDKSATLSFSRVDEDTIAVTLASGEKEYSFNVSKSGAISEE